MFRRAAIRALDAAAVVVQLIDRRRVTWPSWYRKGKL